MRPFRAHCNKCGRPTSSRARPRRPCRARWPAPGAPPQPRTRLLGPGAPAAPDEHSLLLLPSGPDRVRRSSPRRTRPSTLRCPLSGEQRTTSNGTSTPLERVSGYNGPLLRRLARPYQFYSAAVQIPNLATIRPEGSPRGLGRSSRKRLGCEKPSWVRIPPPPPFPPL